jgi:hypothetical protein
MGTRLIMTIYYQAKVIVTYEDPTDKDPKATGSLEFVFNRVYEGEPVTLQTVLEGIMKEVSATVDAGRYLTQAGSRISSENWLDIKANICVSSTHDFITAAGLPRTTAPTQAEDPAKFLVDVGAFFNRAGSAKMPILLCQDVGVKAILTDLQIRHWIDLKLAEVSTGLNYIGSQVPELTLAIQEYMVNAPVQPSEQQALRKLYFS